MIGAIIGDIVGSRFEFNEDTNRGKLFKLFTGDCRITDDSLMTLAVAKALMLCKGNYDNLGKITIDTMVDIGFKHPNVGWGQSFRNWLFVSKTHEPYNSFGNGAGMRISPVGWVANSEGEVKLLSKVITELTHNHPEGIKGAEAIAMGVYLARIGKTKDVIRNRLAYYYPEINDEKLTIKKLQTYYGYDDSGKWITCQGSIPQAIVSFLESDSFEDAIRNAISIGGDSDTIGAMCGGIAEAYYGVPREMEEEALKYMSEDLKEIYFAFNDIKKHQ